MSIATTTQFWTTRWNGGDPANPTSYTGQDNLQFTKNGGYTTGAGADANGSWKIDGVATPTPPTAFKGQKWEQYADGDGYTIVVCFQYNTTPSNGSPLFSMDNGSYVVTVSSTGSDNSLNISGLNTVTITGLDLKSEASFEPKPTILRITVDNAGNGKVYVNEIIEDDMGNSKVTTFTAHHGSTQNEFYFGNNTGIVTWHNVYVSTHGAFSPDEMSTSPFVTDSLMRMAFSVRDLLRNSKRMYLKNMIDDSSIVYGYDVSSGMVSRLAPPTIHIILRELASPEFDVVGGTRITQNYKIILFVTTRGTDYKNAYRMGMDIGGDAFDEIYTNTGLKGDTDSLVSYTVSFDTKMDDDEVVCIHRYEYQYMRRLNMLHR